jgi:hypothetical protein
MAVVVLFAGGEDEVPDAGVVRDVLEAEPPARVKLPKSETDSWLTVRRRLSSCGQILTKSVTVGEFSRVGIRSRFRVLEIP